MRVIAALALVACLVAPLVAGQAPTVPVDHCSIYATCEVCVSEYLCGWCSEPVTYVGNVTGKQCAGYNPNGQDPFECTGIYSIEQCTIGYVCDLDNYQCKQAGAGQGTTLSKCEANCTNMGQVYLCNHTSLKCYEVPRGTSGASSYEVCEASCAHPSPHPASPTPVSPAPPAAVYSCNYTTGECETAQPGKGSSKQVCESQCSKDNGTKYFCNSIAKKCEPAPVGFPGQTKKECEAECLPHPNPGPPPMFLGLWRGIQIQNGYKSGEYDLHVDQASVVFIDILDATTIKGTPFNVQNGENLDFWIKITAGPGVGETIKVIGQTDMRGPETNYLLAAFSAPGGATPGSVNAAMAASTGDAVYSFMSCAGTPECRFQMPSSARRMPHKGRLLDHLRQRVAHKNLHAGGELQRFGGSDRVNDPCEAFSANCSYCLAHEFCGWCSQDVQYKNGEKGKQCAGFASSPNATNPFVCEGRYSTLACDAGWTCNETSYTCEQNASPGNGLPHQECEEVCRPTPSPTPQLQQYVCNITSHQCHKCEEEHCPGSMAESACEAACKKPHKGPTSLVVGIWRGLEIQNNYPLVEVDYVFNATSLTVYRNGQLQFTADVTSFGGDEMIFNVNSGPDAGKTFSAEYTIANQGTGLIEQMTLAMSAADGAIPDNYSGPMQTAGQKELVMVKCNMAPCSFTAPAPSQRN
jgi:hypothetical protein